MYPRPHRIWVAALLCQSGPALAIFEPGSACGMPYAPLLGLLACTFQPLSTFHRLTKQPNWLDDHPYDPSMAAATCCGFPEGCGAEPPEFCGFGDGAGVAAAAPGRCARRSAARWAAGRPAARLAARWAARSARARRTSSLAPSRRAASIRGIPASGCAGAVLAPAIASIEDEFPADAPDVVKPATTAAGTITVTPAIATVILDNLPLCVKGLRCNLWRAGTNHLWSGAFRARLHPRHCRPVTQRPARAEAR